jgi:beta-lactamase superfamily II metal-dependent hydrolase
MKNNKQKIDGKRQRYYAYVEQVEGPPSPKELKDIPFSEHPNPRKRTNYIFDVFREEDAERKLEDTPDLMIRGLTTPNRISKIVENVHSQTDWRIEEGDWYILETSQARGMPRGWIAGEFDQENAIEAMNIDMIRLLRKNGGEMRSISLEHSPMHEHAIRKINECRLEPSILLPYAWPVGLPRDFDAIRAIDVGQASCIAMEKNGQQVAFFDVGFPLPFFKKSLPRKVTELSPAENCLVILSHWDYDHYSWAKKNPLFRELRWIAPEGNLSKSGTKFANSLGDKLLRLPRGNRIGNKNMQIDWATGNPNDKNNSGIVVTINLHGRKVLLTGDAAYNNISPHLLSDLSGVSIPHHGGLTEGNIPYPILTGSKAISCCGQKNSYGHPRSEILDGHRGNLWEVEVTGHVTGHPARGDKWF